MFPMFSSQRCYLKQSFNIERSLALQRVGASLMGSPNRGASLKNVEVSWLACAGYVLG